jgi:hypothetical protein
MERIGYQGIVEGFIGEPREPKEKPLALLNVGSLARGNSDDMSDFDFIIVWNKPADITWQEGACRINGQKCGIRNVIYASLKDKPWSQIERHSYPLAKIEYDPLDLLPPLIREKCVWEKGERVDLFCEVMFKASYIVNIVDNYRNCWNERDELKMALGRGNMLDALYLTADFIHSILDLAIITDGAFVPPHKVSFSEWVKNISPRAYKLYRATMDNLDIIRNPDVNRLKQFYSPYVQGLITAFEAQEEVPENIMEHRNNIARLSKI